MSVDCYHHSMLNKYPMLYRITDFGCGKNSATKLRSYEGTEVELSGSWRTFIQDWIARDPSQSSASKLNSLAIRSPS
jgi:hypothetical protein